MKKLHFSFLTFLFGFAILFSSCNKKEDKKTETDPNVIGNITVALDANKPVVRGTEALIGNMLCDGWMKYAKDSLKISPDFVTWNGGGMRFSADIHTDGIYPAGDYTNDMVEEICAFDNNLVTVKITGKQLKEILERSVSALPTDFEGRFLQCSSELEYSADLSKQVQVLDEVTNPDKPVIITPGQRITSIKVNGTEYSETSEYTMLTSNFITGAGDGYATFVDFPANKISDYGNYRLGFSYYLKNYSPITPVIDGRIKITGN